MIIGVILSLFILSLLSVFQMALALGAPLGRFAWGGQHKVLAKNLRIGSALAIAIYAVFAVFIVSKAAIWELIVNKEILNTGLRLMAAYFVLGVLVNGISRSKPERYTMTPLSLILAICFSIVAAS